MTDSEVQPPRSDAAKPPRSNASKLRIMAGALVLGVVIAEGAMRVRAHDQNKRTLDAALDVSEQPNPTGRTRFVDIIRSHPNDDIIYELRPNLDTTFKGKHLETSSAGFRDREYPLRAEPGELTIVGIGASMMFGHGLANGEEYASLLETDLNERHGARKWRFINTAVPSHNVVMKVEVLREKGLAYAPDLVFLNVAGNNLDLPQYIRSRKDPLAADRSYLLDFFRGLVDHRDEEELRVAEMAWVDRKQIEWGSNVVTVSEDIPEQYRDLVGWAPFRRALDDLRELSLEHDFEVVMFAFIEHDLVPSMLEEGRQRGFQIISLMEDLEAYLRERTGAGFAVDTYTSSDLVVGGNNMHPSVIQHRMAADRILSDMESSGLLQRLMAR